MSAPRARVPHGPLASHARSVLDSGGSYPVEPPPRQPIATSTPDPATLAADPTAPAIATSTAAPTANATRGTAAAAAAAADSGAARNAAADTAADTAARPRQVPEGKVLSWPEQRRVTELHFTPGQTMGREELLSTMLASYHGRPRRTLREPPLLYATPILDRRPYTQPYCYAPLMFPCCTRNAYRVAYLKKRNSGGADSEDDMYATEDTRHDRRAQRGGNGSSSNRNNDEHAVEMTPANRDMGPGTVGSVTVPIATTSSSTTHRDFSAPGDASYVPSEGVSAVPRRRQPSNREEDDIGDCHAGCNHLLYRCFCLRCAIAQQTNLLFREEERRQRYPYRFCCECFFGAAGNYARTLATIVLCDLCTGGLFIPCSFSYQGLGTALYGWRIRYLIRCRYSMYDITILDLLRMLCAPMLAVDQQGTEMAVHGLYETPGVCYRIEMR